MYRHHKSRKKRKCSAGNQRGKRKRREKGTAKTGKSENVVLEVREKRKYMQEKNNAAALEELIQVVAALRSENGCPWDKVQTMESLKPCMINEMTEAIAAIDLFHATGSSDNLCEELGDVLLQVVFLAQIASEKGLFQMEDVIRGISQKMIRRHPHVFGDNKVTEAEEIPGRWEEIKRLEKNGKTMEQKAQEKAAFEAAAGQILAHFRTSP